MNESETRAELIDPALTAAGWGSVEDLLMRRDFKITDGRKANLNEIQALNAEASGILEIIRGLI